MVRLNRAVSGLITFSAEIEQVHPGHVSRISVNDITVPDPPPDGCTERWQWEWNNIGALMLTGAASNGVSYFVTITASSDDALLPVGTEFEFSPQHDTVAGGSSMAPGVPAAEASA